MSKNSLKLITISFICAVILTIAYNEIQKPVYQSTAEIELNPKLFLGEVSDKQTVDNFIAIESKIITSHSIISKVSADLNLSKSLEKNVFTKRIENTNIIRIAITFEDPRKATDIVNEIIHSYTQEKKEDVNKKRQSLEKEIGLLKDNLRANRKKYRLYSEKDISGELLNKQLIELQLKLGELQTKYTDRHPEVINLKNQIKVIEKQLISLSGKEIETSSIFEKIKEDEKLLSESKKTLREISSDEKEIVRIISPPSFSQKPIKPNKTLNLFVGGVLGILFGLFLSLKQGKKTISLKKIEKIETALNIKSIGIIPHIEKDTLLFYHSAKSLIAEAYYTLWSDINFSITGKESKVLLFTSATPEEGKTLTATNFAIASAVLGLRTLLVDANFQKPDLHKLFNLPKTPGLSEILSGGLNWRNVVHGIDNFLSINPQLKLKELYTLKILTNGNSSFNFFESEVSKGIDTFIKDVKKEFNLIIFDSPSMFSSAEAGIFASKINNIVLIYHPAKTTINLLRRAKSQLENIHANILGLVVNDARISDLRPQPAPELKEYLTVKKMERPQQIKKVLIVDDEQSVVNTITRILLKKSKYTYQIASSSNGLDALQQIDTFKPDLIILDLRLPGLDGFDVCKTIRSDPQKKNIKILAITGYADKDTRIKILNCGADEYLAKPFELDKFMECINNLPG